MLKVCRTSFDNANLKYDLKVTPICKALLFTLFSFSEIVDMQKRLKWALERIWKNAPTHDWIPLSKAKTFSLKDYYVGLRWQREVKRALENYRVELTNMRDILKIAHLDRPTRILVEGKESFSFPIIATC